MGPRRPIGPSWSGNAQRKVWSWSCGQTADQTISTGQSRLTLALGLKRKK